MQNRVWGRGALEAIHAADQWRVPRAFDARGPVGVFDGKQVVSFASNDYLGLSAHPALRDAACAGIQQWGTGSTASRLVVGTRPCHDELETELASWKRTDAALVVSSGYAANLSILSVLGGPDCCVVSDALNHASIIDGCRLSRSSVAISRHNDVAHVDALLSESTALRNVVVTDAVFSMDGDQAPIVPLGEVCARHDALLVIDEAHAVLGPDVGALAQVDGLEFARVVTLSKALGSAGGAVCGPRWLIELLINRARPFIFSTAPTPADVCAALTAVRLVQSPSGVELIARLATLVERVAPGHTSPIIPVLVGAEADAISVAARFLERGMLIPAIRPPTVAPGTSRLRVALTAAHSDEMVNDLIGALDDFGLRP